MKKLSYQEKLSWLKKHNIIKKKKPVKSTVNRLYSFYQRNPLDTPKHLAYGMKKRLKEKYKTQEPEKTYLRTPEGKITVKEYIQKQSQKTKKEIKKETTPDTTWQIFDHRFRSGKIEDRFRYVINRKQGLTIHALNLNNMMKHIKKHIIPDIMEIIELYYSKRKPFYKNRRIGAIIIYDTYNVPGEPIPRPVAFTKKIKFEKYLMDMLEQLIIIDIIRHYKNAQIRLKYIDIFIRTKQTPSNIDKML